MSPIFFSILTENHTALVPLDGLGRLICEDGTIQLNSALEFSHLQPTYPSNYFFSYAIVVGLTDELCEENARDKKVHTSHMMSYEWCR